MSNFADPYEPHPRDLVVVKVIHPSGVKLNGRHRPPGDVVEMIRAVAGPRVRNKQCEIITVVHYYKGPAVPASVADEPPADWDTSTATEATGHEGD